MVQQVVIVSGATSDIGLGIAQSFAKRKWQVVINGIEKPTEVQPLLGEIQKLSGQAPLYSSAELSTPDGCRELVNQTLAQFKRIDVLINNAGIQNVAPIVEFPQERWEKIINLNLAACFYACQAALPSMYTNKWGRLILISSAHGIVGSANKAAYVAAKHGVLGLSKVIALESTGTG